MAHPSWSINGRYYETCSCDFLCPCILTQMAAKPSRGSCTFAMGFTIERGSFGDLSLDGLGFMVLGYTPEEMSKGNWSVGVIVDERATAQQRDAIATIASGAAGGPMAVLGPMVGTMLGLESAPIRFTDEGNSWAVTAGRLVDIAASAAMGLNPEASRPLQLSGTGHPAADTVSLAHATRSHATALGLSWNDASGRNSAQYAPFSWAG